MADTLFAPTAQAAASLEAEAAAAGRVHLVGSTAVDSLRRAERVAGGRAAWRRFGAEQGRYVLVTLHRPANVDDDERLARIVEALAAPGPPRPGDLPAAPAHPRAAEADGRRPPAARGGRAVRPAARLPRLPLAPGGRRRGGDRLRHGAGGDVRARRALLHAAGLHRARRSRSRTGPTRCWATTRATSPTCGWPPGRRRRARSRCGTAAPPRGSPTPSWRTTRWCAPPAADRPAGAGGRGARGAPPPRRVDHVAVDDLAQQRARGWPRCRLAGDHGVRAGVDRGLDRRGLEAARQQDHRGGGRRLARLPQPRQRVRSLTHLVDEDDVWTKLRERLAGAGAAVDRRDHAESRGVP